jgi:transposase-like protein
MKAGERKEEASLPLCPNPNCRESHVVRNGSHRGRQRYHCRACKTYFGETEGTPMYGLKTPAAEVAQALLVVMRRGSLRAAEEITGHTYETISVWRVSGGQPCSSHHPGDGQRSAPEPSGNR